MTPDDPSDCDWHAGSEIPDDDRPVAFELIHDSVRHVGRFRNGLYVELAVAARLWAPRAVEHWAYLEVDGQLKRKRIEGVAQKIHGERKFASPP